jgi:methylmalonyl-CoA mutase
MEDILAGFDPAGAADWKAQLTKDLKGITFEQLSRIDDNGITIEPFYTIEDVADHDTKPVFAHTDWSIMERIVVNQEQEANKLALQTLATGASGLIFEVAAENTDWATLLNGVEVAYIHTFFNLRNATDASVEALTAYLKAHNAVQATIGHDTLSDYVQVKATAEAFAAAVNRIAQSTGQLIVDGSLYYNAGSPSVYQLGLITAQVNEYLQALADRNALNTVKQLHVTVATGTAFFEEIAKVRALRQLLQLLTAQYDINPEIAIQAITGTLYKAPYDAYNNLLRDTLAGMAAVMGGSDAVYILPFDEGHSKGKEAFSRRMSVNTQLLFKEESYLHHIADVANGSYYLETLTAEMGTKGWDVFKEIEAAGGFIQSFNDGILTGKVAAQAADLLERYRNGSLVWIGMNKYPNQVDMPQPAPVPQHEQPGIYPLSLATII